jgi:hypothetical protein
MILTNFESVALTRDKISKRGCIIAVPYSKDKCPFNAAQPTFWGRHYNGNLTGIAKMAGDKGQHDSFTIPKQIWWLVLGFVEQANSIKLAWMISQHCNILRAPCRGRQVRTDNHLRNGMKAFRAFDRQ